MVNVSVYLGNIYQMSNNALIATRIVTQNAVVHYNVTVSFVDKMIAVYQKLVVSVYAALGILTLL
jgi:hypothetical protein